MKCNSLKERHTKTKTMDFFRIYYGECDIQKLTTLLHPDISWIDGNLQKKHVEKDQVIRHLLCQQEEYTGMDQIDSLSCQTTSFVGKMHVADGLVVLKEGDGGGEHQVRYSLLWIEEDENLRLIHANLWNEKECLLEENQQYKLLKYCAEYDTVTGVLNKATTQQQISEFLETGDHRTRNHALFMIDIDHFKEINDRFGHYVGDEVIKSVARRIRSLFREYDIIGRVGGDEFSVFMKDVKSHDVVERKARELCNILSKTYKVGTLPCEASVSVGISLYNGDGKSYEYLYRQADDQLYEAKRNGRNQYQILC